MNKTVLDETHWARAIHAYNVGVPQTRYSFRECLNIIALQKELLANNVPYSIQMEIDLNTKITDYINMCIRYMNTFKKWTGDVELPIAHNLLRFYRDHNHHAEAETNFRPVQLANDLSTDFYIHPILWLVPSVTKRYSEWSKRGNAATLTDLLQRNQHFVEEVFAMTKTRLGVDGKQAKYLKEYPMWGTSLGKDSASVEESWTLDR
jgi:hypothetical protein